MAPQPQKVADGVWRLAGDFRGGMNVYFLADEGGVTMFDAGTRPMTKHCARVAAELGGLRRIVLGHADTDHRGSAPSLDAPVLCHPDARPYAESDEWPGYWQIDEIPSTASRLIYPFLHRRWDGGAVKISGTLSEGDEVAGFEVKHFPGHAPGLIGLWRESDRLALVSDTIYMVDSIKLKPFPDPEAPSVPHPVWNQDTRQAAESVRKLAALEPRAVWPGHLEAVQGEPDEVRARLERAAARVL